MAQTMFQTLGGGSSSGAGGLTLDWYIPDSSNFIPGSVESLGNGMQCLVFDYSEINTFFSMFTVPNSYASGTQIFLKKGKAWASPTTGNFLVRTVAYIFKAGVVGTSLPTGYTSTNTQQAVDPQSNEIVTIDDLDLTNSSGQINSVTVAASDTILIRLQRLPGSETSGVAANLYLPQNSFEVVMT